MPFMPQPAPAPALMPSSITSWVGLRPWPSVVPIWALMRNASLTRQSMSPVKYCDSEEAPGREIMSYTPNGVLAQAAPPHITAGSVTGS